VDADSYNVGAYTGWQKKGNFEKPNKNW
jgi:hypothetical protein